MLNLGAITDSLLFPGTVAAKRNRQASDAYFCVDAGQTLGFDSLTADWAGILILASAYKRQSADARTLHRRLIGRLIN